MSGRRKGFTLVEILIVVAIMGLIMAIILPNYLKNRRDAQSRVCSTNLVRLLGAKQQWGFANSAEDDAVPTMDDLIPYLNRGQGEVACPSGGEYTIGKMTNPPTCSKSVVFGGHRIE